MDEIKSIFKCIYFYLMIFLSYGLCCLFSSKEAIFDGLLFFLIAVFSFIWTWIFYLSKNKRIIVIIQIVSILLGLVLPCIGIMTEQFMLKRIAKDFLFWYSLPLAFILGEVSIRNVLVKNLLKIIATFVYCVFIIPSLILVFYFVKFKTLLSVDGILAVLQTSNKEVQEFIVSYISFDAVIIVLLIISTFIYCTYKLFGYTYIEFKDASRKAKIILEVLAVLIFIGSLVFYDKSYVGRIAHSAKLRYKDIQMYNQYRNKRDILLSKEEVQIDDKNLNFALIIGETHSKSNVSAYGYVRDTTPWLSDQVRQGKIILLGNAYSCAAQTDTAMMMALTEFNQYKNLEFNKSMTIIEIAKRAGYKVVWISNQLGDNIVAHIGNESDIKYWVNDMHNDTWQHQDNGIYDEKVIECLRSIDKPCQKTLYVINLLGSHATYKYRYPRNFNKWDDSNDILNSYDNSVLYNDYIMSKIVDILHNKLDVAAISYTADHGEETQVRFCHGTEYFEANYKKLPSACEIVKIPVYFSLKDDYKSVYPEIYKSLRENQNIVFTNDMMYDTMLGIMHIKSSHYTDRYDISSERYGMNMENARTLHGRIKIADVNYNLKSR